MDAAAYRLPKASDSSGLAEWTSRIKALQKQVDDDEEAEQRKLEEEIRASRLARQRRSQMYGQHTGGSFNGKELGRSPLRDTLDDTSSPTQDRQTHQESALRNLMGTSSNATITDEPTSILEPTPPPPPPKPAATARPLPATPGMGNSTTKQEPISLAQFMGGRATGPRLNRHAPQQDAHDPTQFEQRSAREIGMAPHPVFGRSGVAMPGMAKKDGPAVKRDEEGERAKEREEKKERRTSGGGVAKRYVEKLEEQRTTNGVGARTRERTMSASSGAAPVKRVTSPLFQTSQPPDIPSKSDSNVRGSISQSPVSATFTSNGRSTSNTVPTPARSPVMPSFTGCRPITPQRQSFSSPHSSSTPTTPSSAAKKHAVPITIPLARPLQPEPKPSPLFPQIPASQNPSPAFLKPPPHKDPTPSLTKLQGRGFVQNMVKVSSQLSSGPSELGERDSQAGKGSVQSGKRKSSVLDRWPTANDRANGSSSGPPIIQPKPVQLPMRKTKTMNHAEVPEIVQPVQTGRPTILRSVSSTATPVRTNVTGKPEGMSGTATPVLGSGNTLISYIKPVKTGDAPPTSQAPSRPRTAPPVEETRERAPVSERSNGKAGSGSGLSERSGGGSGAYTGLPPPSGKTLSHPTKDRAKVKRKARDGQPGAKVRVEESIPEEQHTVGKSSEETSTAAPATPPSEPSDNLAAPAAPPSPPSPAKTPPSPQVPLAKDEPVNGIPTPPPSVTESSVGRLASKWANENLIGVKSVTPTSAAGRASPQPEATKSKAELTQGMLGRKALPGLANTSPSMPPVQVPQKEERSPSGGAPATRQKHARIPSTGNRATVMDVAQAFQEHHSREASPAPPSPVPPSPAQLLDLQQVASPIEGPEALPGLDERSPTSPAPRNLVAPLSGPAERRRSSFERYSPVLLPPLVEEKTPVPSPAGTLSRTFGKAVAPEHSDGDHAKVVADGLGDVFEPIADEAKEDPVQEQPEEPQVIRLEHKDEPLPHIDVESLVKSQLPHFVPDPNDRTVSVDLMVILGNAATTVQEDTNIFYDTEVLAIIHRSKSKASGLVATKVWGWCGKNSQLGEREERKLQELAKRYGTTLERVKQYAEPQELVHVLGGQLAIRQGARAHWSPENTAMHLVRLSKGYIFIDEHDIGVKNLCSAFSYCLTILGTVYVWYGCGSLPQERQAAFAYARGLAGDDDNIVELIEGESDDDEMFWMILGDDEYAKADYWQWRSSISTPDPRAWRVDTGNKAQAVSAVSSFVDEATPRSSVYIIDCIWEFFVLVGSDARANRSDIRLALSIADEMSKRTAESKPFAPTVHTVIFPSQLPQDLRLNFRDLDESQLNDGEVADHMNILPVATAYDHLQKIVWEKAALQDQDLLPLGLHSSMLAA